MLPTKLTERLEQLGPARMVLLALAVLLVGILIISLLKTALSSVSDMAVDSSSSLFYNDGKSTTGGYGANERAAYDADMPGTAPAPSMRNIMPPEEGESYVAGDDAESFETRAYSASIRTTALDHVCDTVMGWKPMSYVVFEQQSRSDTSCYARFKVERERSDEILHLLEELDPDELVVNTETIKEQVVDYTSRLDILLRTQAVTEETLEQATAAYDDLVSLARQAEDVSSLAKVIDSKLLQLERLTRERINIAAQIEQLTRQKAEALDRLEYAQFDVRVSKYEIVNWDGVKESWVSSLQQFVRTVNETVQALTVGLLANVLQLALLLVYLFILLVVGKFTWHFVRKFWQA